MSKIGHIAWKELRSYFSSWMAYAILAGWLLVGALIWSQIVFDAAAPGGFQIAPLYGNLLTILLFIAPLLTMRLLAEEKREGSLEMLLTSPLTEWQVTLGKYFGALAFVVAMLVFTAHFPFFSFRYGSLDAGPMWGGYIALFCVSSAFIAWGLFCSSLSDSSVLAGFLAFGGLLISWLLGWLQESAQSSDLAAFVVQFSVLTHVQPMLRGAIDTKDLVFFASLSFLFLFATVRVLESRKWR
ncbi:MAG: gliding motility-associated transport system permease protein [Abditibacteriota bacterium]|jgi:ABC-2 type transport system permease protein|nr:gliding motility-associated transport system permease protein [Abditibacteriota bacterium]